MAIVLLVGFRHYRAKEQTMDVKTVITYTALLLWVANTVYAFFVGEFSTTFDFFKEVFLTIIAFYLGTQSKKGNTDDNE